MGLPVRAFTLTGVCAFASGDAGTDALAVKAAAFLNENAQAQALLGTHDFAAFAASGSVATSTVRTIYRAQVTRSGETVALTVLGDGFLYNMVRIIAGTLMEVGTGKRAPGAIASAIATGDRLALGQTAPAKGLTLMRVLYGGDEETALAFFQ